VRRLYELCATGEHSIGELAAIAHAEHLTRGGPIPKSTVSKILRLPINPSVAETALTGRK